MDLAFRRDVYDDISPQACLAGQPPIPEGLVLRCVAALYDAGLREVFPTRGDPLLGEIALAADDLAAPAHGASAANGIYVNTEGTGGLQQSGAGSENVPRLPLGKKHGLAVGICRGVHADGVHPKRRTLAKAQRSQSFNIFL